MMLKTLLTAFVAVQAHMPKFQTENSVDNPEDLGDVTLNSWAINRKLGAEDVHYYKIDVPATPKDGNDKQRFKLGMYVPPGPIEKDFTYYVAVWGFDANTKCLSKQKNGAWGRRL